MTLPDYDDLTYQELLAQRRAERSYQRRLAAHPDPRDPDHPGEWASEEQEPTNA